jgi:hypothetical protein
MIDSVQNDNNDCGRVFLKAPDPQMMQSYLTSILSEGTKVQ